MLAGAYLCKFLIKACKQAGIVHVTRKLARYILGA
jgi:hypothetical protein